MCLYWKPPASCRTVLERDVVMVEGRDVICPRPWWFYIGLAVAGAMALAGRKGRA
jgi:hypothetical protein